MFCGTYRSEFYRAIRDLLHAQTSEAQPADLQQRWALLIESEASFRQQAPSEMRDARAGEVRV